MVPRTQVGIVEWARRARSAELTGRAVADALGRAVQAIDDPVPRLALLDRARRHGWCADQWASVVPVLHDVDLSAVATIDGPELRNVLDARPVTDGRATLAAEAAATTALRTKWAEWADEAGAVADAPFAFAAARTLAELGAGPPR